MKRILSVIFAAVILAAMSSCTTKEADFAEENITEEITDIPDESRAEILAEETEAAAEPAKKADELIPSPDEKFLREIFDGSSGTVVFTLDADGKYSAASEESIYEYDEMQMMHEYVTMMLSEEYYEEYKEYFDEEVSSYEEYKAMLEEIWGEDLEKYLEYEPEETESLAYFIINTYSYIAEGETAKYSDEEIFLRAADWLFENINNDPEIAGNITDCFEKGENYYSTIVAYYEGKDVIETYIGFAGSRSDYSRGEISDYLDEVISVSGENGFIIGKKFIPADTERLFISSRTEATASMLFGDDVPEGYLYVCADYDRYDNVEKIEFDFAEIAEKLPHLKGLYMYQAVGTNTEAIAKLKDLEALSYYVSLNSEYPYDAKSDIPFKELPKLKDLRLYGEYDDYGFLTEMPSLESVYVRITKETPLDKLFECTAVTSLEIEAAVDLNGIEKLTKLESLTINFNDPDLAPVGKLKNLKYLEIYCHSGVKNISALGNLSGLEELFLHSLKNHDWKFLKDLKNVKTFTVMYVEDIYNDDIKQMPWLEELSMTETMTTYSLIGDMPNLKSVHVSDIIGSSDDFEGSDTLESYSEMFGRRGSYECLGKCPNLKNIILWGCNGNIDAENLSGLSLEKISLDGTSIENPLALGNIKTLKRLYITASAGDEDIIRKLSEMLPDCEIIGGDDFFHNSAY